MYTDIDFTKNNYTDLVIRYAVKMGPTKLVLHWESDTRDYQVIPQQYLFNRLNSGTTPYLFSVSPDITNSTMTTLVNTDYQIALVGI